MMKYKSVMATRRGGPQVLRVVENELREPSDREARIKVLAAAVCLPDVQARYGQCPFPPKMPFTPGYALIGIIDKVGRDVSNFAAGDRVAALTVYGAYAEYLYWNAKGLIPIPGSLAPEKAIPLILNYLVAYQTLHRVARVKAGDKILIIGASGGIGTAFLQLGKLAELKMYGIASGNKHSVLAEYGAIPIDYRTQDFVQVIRKVEPEGLDAVFDGMGGDYFTRSYGLLRRGGKLVGYGNPLGISSTLKLLGQTVLFNLLPNGRSAAVYGTSLSIFNSRPFLEDWCTLFQLLEDGKIDPVITARFPILEAAQANERLESGQISGNIVLLAPELL